jgi:fumarate reductase subunit D
LFNEFNWLAAIIEPTFVLIDNILVIPFGWFEFDGKILSFYRVQ